MNAEGNDLLQEFERLLASTKRGLVGSLDVLLMQMEPEQEGQLRLCAIPHQFGPTILRVLVPGMPTEESEQVCGELADLAMVQPASDGQDLILHDEARRFLFDQWLDHVRGAQFREASSRLVAFYEQQAASADGVELEIAHRNRMFHLIGADQAVGFAEFQRMHAVMWHEFRLNECAVLAKLVHEYDRVLSSVQRMWLTYYEGRHAAAQRQWDAAERRLSEIVNDDEAPPDLRLKSYQQLAIAHSEQRDWDSAIELFEKALEIAQSSDEHADVVDDIMHGLGCVLRDTGDLKRAEKTFLRCIKLAGEQNDLDTLARSHNSLGTLYRRLGNSQKAIKMYKQSLDYLEQNEDHFRPAQVHNNLGLTYADVRDWLQSEKELNRSLEISREVGDIRGQAKALMNLTRTYMNRGELLRSIGVSMQAVDLFEEVKDYYSAAVVKSNLGKLYHKEGDQRTATLWMEAAADQFEMFGEEVKAKAVRKDLEIWNQQHGDR